MSTFSGRRQFLFDVTMLPAVEKYPSELADVDGIAKYVLAKAAIIGYLSSRVLHHSKGFKSNRS